MFIIDKAVDWELLTLLYIDNLRAKSQHTTATGGKSDCIGELYKV